MPGNLESLARVRDFVKRVSQQAGLDKQNTYRLMLAVDEMVANIIIHGYQEAGLSGEIDVTAQVADGEFSITLDDTAVPYDPLERQDPIDLDTPLEERQIGGLGVFLAKRGGDQLLHEYVNGHNKNSFVVQLADKAN